MSALFINWNREKSQPQLCLRSARHTQRQIHKQSLTSKQQHSQSWEATKTLKDAVTQGQHGYFQVPLSLGSFLDSTEIMTIAEHNRASQQSVVFTFALQSFLSNLLSGC